MKKKKIIYILLLLLISTTITVNASEIKVFNFGVNCTGLFTAEGVELIRKYLNYFRILGPIALIVFVGIDLLRAVISGDDQAVKKVQQSILNRFIATLLLFLVPTMVRFALGLPAVQEKIQIPDDPLCNALKSDVKNNGELL